MSLGSTQESNMNVFTKGWSIRGRKKFWLRQQRICLQCWRSRFNPWIEKIPWRRQWLHKAVFLPGESHGQNSLVGYSPWGHRDTRVTNGFNFCVEEWHHFLEYQLYSSMHDSLASHRLWKMTDFYPMKENKRRKQMLLILRLVFEDSRNENG